MTGSTIAKQLTNENGTPLIKKNAHISNIQHLVEQFNFLSAHGVTSGSQLRDLLDRFDQELKTTEEALNQLDDRLIRQQQISKALLALQSDDGIEQGLAIKLLTDLNVPQHLTYDKSETLVEQIEIETSALRDQFESIVEELNQTQTIEQEVSKTRYRLKNKHEIACLSNTEARERMMNYIYNHYEITENTILITNSDHGHGYTPYVFKELKDLLQIKQHHHFWDLYHLNKKIKEKMKFAGTALMNKVFKAVQAHDKGLLRVALDTAESLIEDEEHQEEFISFKRKILNNFQYTKPAEMRGFSNAGIGIMESQHRKITYRMKKRGMYWSLEGANTMTQLIILNYQNELRDLFFGDWRERYAKYQEVEKIPHRANAKSTSKTHQVKQRVTPKKHK